MSTTNQPAIAVSSLVKSYSPDRPNAVDGISFEIRRGEVFGLLGPNGAGKTTTVKTILGLVLPTSGSAHLAGYDMSSQRHQALRHAGPSWRVPATSTGGFRHGPTWSISAP